MLYNILDYNAVGDGITKCTKAIQSAINDCSITGGRVYIPSGIFLSGSLRLLSNVELYLDKGAVLRSSLDEEDMIDFSKDFVDDNADTGWEGGCFLFACHERNITIQGMGVIDGQGREVFYDDEPLEAEHECPLNVRGFRPRLSFLEDIENLVIKDVTFYDAAFWTLHMAGCRKVRIENIVIDNNRRAPNTDGIDPDCCSDVIISGCKITSGDDAVVIKSTAPMYEKYGESRDIVINSCILSTSCSAIKIGTETYGDIHDIIISDCIIRDCIRGIGIWSRDGGDIYNIVAHHIIGSVRNYSDSSTRTEGIYSWWGEGDPVFMSSAQREGVDRIPGIIHDINIDNLNMTAENPVLILGEDYSPIQRVTITNSRILLKKVSSKQKLIADERPSKRGRYDIESMSICKREVRDLITDITFIKDKSFSF